MGEQINAPASLPVLQKVASNLTERKKITKRRITPKARVTRIPLESTVLYLMGSAPQVMGSRTLIYSPTMVTTTKCYLTSPEIESYAYRRLVDGAFVSTRMVFAD